MTKLYFVRHCQPDTSSGYNPGFPLTEQGKRDALLVADILSDKDITAVYSSSYPRAVMTVEPFAQSKGLEIHKEFGLRERDGGRWQGSFDNYADYIAAQLADFECKVPEGESLYEVQSRCMEAVNRILALHEGESVAIGIHGMALSTVLRYYFPNFGEKDFYRIVDLMPLVLRLDVENGTVTGYDIELAVKRVYPNGYLNT
ncbi:MAG: histidine phosphatase family protein [Ruminococcus sp.]|nr:histidine phosphatase family protein [Ruminococcus sp.]